jgi:hypothetical protein
LLGNLVRVERVRAVEVPSERGERERGGSAVRDQEEQRSQADRADTSILLEVLEEPPERASAGET